MAFKVYGLGPSDVLVNGTGSDTYTVGSGGEVRVTQAGVLTIWPRGSWSRLVDQNPA